MKAKNASGESAWSSAVTFEVNTQSTPFVTAPAAIVNSARPQIAWTGSPAATFELWVNQLGGTSKIIHDTTVAGPSLIPSSDLPSGTYRVWVRLRGETGSPGPWSAAYDFTIALNDTPDQVVVSGVSATATARPVFAWAAATHATRYEIWVNSISGTATRVVSETNLTDLQYTATTDLAQGQYRVCFRSGGTNESNCTISGRSSLIFVWLTVTSQLTQICSTEGSFAVNRDDCLLSNKQQ